MLTPPQILRLGCQKVKVPTLWYFNDRNTKRSIEHACDPCYPRYMTYTKPFKVEFRTRNVDLGSGTYYFHNEHNDHAENEL